MEPQILTEQQKRSIQGQLIEAGYPDPEKMLNTANKVFAGLDRVERDGIVLFDGESGTSMFSILLFVDKGDGDYRHFSTRASWQWPSPILRPELLNMVVDEYHLEKGGIPHTDRIKDQLMIQVDKQNKADQAMMNEPLKSAFEGLGIPGATRLVSSGAWKEGILFLDALRYMWVQGSETGILLRLGIIAQLSTTDGSPPFIAQVTVTPELTKELVAPDKSRAMGELRYHYGQGPIPDMEKIKQDVHRLFTKQHLEVSPDNTKVRHIPENQPQPGPTNDNPYRPRR